MSLIGRVTVGPQPGQEALEAVPEMELRLEDIRAGEGDQWRVIFWASGDDFDAYETALDGDAAVGDYDCLTVLPDRRLYRVSLSEASSQRVLHSILVDFDITIIRLTMDAEWVYLLARFPSREALSGLREACRERDVTFRLEHLYEEEAMANDGGPASRYGLTEAQQTALLEALELGYFDVPRGTTMEAVADELGVSTTALSKRLRRGQQALLGNTLAREGGI